MLWSTAWSLLNADTHQCWQKVHDEIIARRQLAYTQVQIARSAMAWGPRRSERALVNNLLVLPKLHHQHIWSYFLSKKKPIYDPTSSYVSTVCCFIIFASDCFWTIRLQLHTCITIELSWWFEKLLIATYRYTMHIRGSHFTCTEKLRFGKKNMY